MAKNSAGGVGGKVFGQNKQLVGTVTRVRINFGVFKA